MKKLILLMLICIGLSCNNSPKKSDNNNTLNENEMEYTELEGLETDQPCTNLFDNAWLGNLKCVKIFIEQGADIDTVDKRNGASLLLAAASSNNTELIEYLLSKGSNVKYADASGETALHYSAWKGNADAVKILVENGADVNVIYNANGGLTPLCCAVESGSMETVKYLIDKGADVNYTNKDSGASPLRSAAYQGNFDIFKYIISKNSNNKYDWQEVLFYGIIGRSLDIIKYTVDERGANVNTVSKIWRELPIQKAADNKYTYLAANSKNNLAIIEYLVSKGAKLKDITSENLIAWAMNHSDDETIEYFLQQGYKYKGSTDKYGWEPLPTALDNSSFIIAKHLLNEDKDPYFREQPLVVFFADDISNSPDIIDFLIKNGINKKHYSQAFLSSAKNNKLKSIELLLNAQVDINFKSDEGLNALAYTTNEEVAQYLIEKGIDTKNRKMLEQVWNNFPVLKALEKTGNKIAINQGDADKGLWKAAQLGDLWAVNYFISKGVQLNNIQIFKHNYHREIYKLSPLMVNAYQGYEHCDYSGSMISDEITKALIKAGADVNLKDNRGKTALHIACGDQNCLIDIWPIPMGNRRDREMGAHGDPAFPPKQAHNLIVKTLLDAKAKINDTDNDDNTPLILAAQNENTEIIKLLIEAKADVNTKNKKGKTALFYASEKRNTDIENTLIQSGALK